MSGLERFKSKAAILIAVGALGLGAAGCSSPDSGPDRPGSPNPTASPEVPTPHYTVAEGADKLPTIPDAAVEVPVNNFLSTVEFNVAAEQPNPDNPTDRPYEQLLNFDPKSNTFGDRLPYGNSAPVVDVMLNSKGELVYQDFTLHNDLTNEEKKILHYVQGSQGVIVPAMKAGGIGKLHFRIGEPDSSGDYETKTEASYIPEDFNDNGKPSVYFQMKGVDYIDGETVGLELSHEAMHALFGKEGVENISPAEKEAVNQACISLREDALKSIYDNGGRIVEYLEAAKSLMHKTFRPAMQEVIDSIKAGTYEDTELHFGNSMPNCFSQLPSDAYQQAASHIRAKLKKPLDDGNTKNLGLFEEYVQAANGHWNDLIKQTKVYSALSESTYLPPVRNEAWGHGYENPDELIVSLNNLVLNEPQALGKNVAGLPKEKKQAIVTIAKQGVSYLLRVYANDTEFTENINKQYLIFSKAANV